MNVEDHLHNLTQYTYDNAGNLKTVKDARDKTTTFTYNEINLPSSILNPIGKTKQFTYNADRLLGRILDAKNQPIKFEYDAANQLKFKYLSEETVSYGYDSGGNLNSIQDSDSKLSFTYDQLNRLTKAQTLSGGIQPVITQSYTYDKNNSQETWVDVQNKTFYYNYDNLNRLFNIRDYDSVDSTTFAQYVYDLLSRRTQVIYPNTTRNLFGYNKTSNLTDVTHRTSSNIFGSFVYALNKVGYRETTTTPTGTHQFSYDDIYRLTEANHPDSPDETFTYDAVGNRKNLGVPPDWVYDDANRLQDDGTYQYVYDDNGNMTQKILKVNPNQKAIFTYNSENQLTKIENGGSTIEYAYDGLGRRIQKKIGGVVTAKYVYDKEDITAEYNASNVLQATWLHGPGIDESIYMERGGQKYYYHADGLGSITELTNSSGAVVQTYQYDSFGNIVAQTGTLVNPFTYTGREFDPESGLLYYRARYMDPQIGRFLQEDPIGMAGGINYYSYVFNNPLNFSDPSGLDTVGCDVVPNLLETPCVLECCAEHDQCYDQYNCTAKSWRGNQCEPEECSNCNENVKDCFWKCGWSSKDDPTKQNYYCASQHRYVTIPGDFPDRETAEQACEYDHSTDR